MTDPRSTHTQASQTAATSSPQETPSLSSPSLTTYPLVADPSLLQDFVQESRDQVLTAEVQLLNLKDLATDTQAMEQVLRALNSLRSAAGFLHLKDIGTCSQEAESLMEFALRGDIRMTHAIIDLLFQALDTLKTLLTHVETALASDKKLQAWPQVPQIVEALREAFMDQLLGSSPSLSENSSPPSSPPAEEPCFQKTVGSYIQELIALAPAINNRIRDARERHDYPGCLASQFEAVLKGLEHALLERACAPLEELTSTLEKHIQGLNTLHEKHCDLIVLGEEGHIKGKTLELIERSVKEILSYVIPHKMEGSAQRLELGKEERGTVLLTSTLSSGALQVQCSHDGQGEELPSSLLKEEALMQTFKRVEQAGGELTLSSQKKGSTTFHFTLPIS